MPANWPLATQFDVQDDALVAQASLEAEPNSAPVGMVPTWKAQPITPELDGGRAVVVQYQRRGRRFRPGHCLGLVKSREAFLLHKKDAPTRQGQNPVWRVNRQIDLGSSAEGSVARYTLPTEGI